jgi:hypothetical protein
MGTILILIYISGQKQRHPCSVPDALPVGQSWNLNLKGMSPESILYHYAQLPKYSKIWFPF